MNHINQQKVKVEIELMKAQTAKERMQTLIMPMTAGAALFGAGAAFATILITWLGT